MNNFLIKFWNYIKKLVTKIFSQNKLMLNETKTKKSNNCDGNENKNTIDKLKEQYKNNIITKEIINIVETNPKVLNDLNTKQLNVINNYYKENIEILDESINKIENDIKDIQKLIDYYSNKNSNCLT